MNAPDPIDISSPVPLAVAARVMGLGESTLRNWIRMGAPTARTGGVGRGNGALVIIADLWPWYAKRLGIPAQGESNGFRMQFHRLLSDYFLRDSGAGVPAHRAYRIPPGNAAAYLVGLYGYVLRREGEDPDDRDNYPQEMLSLMETALK